MFAARVAAPEACVRELGFATYVLREFARLLLLTLIVPDSFPEKKMCRSGHRRPILTLHQNTGLFAGLKD